MPAALVNPKDEEMDIMPGEEEKATLLSPELKQEASPSPLKKGRSTISGANGKTGPQLIDHLPLAEAEARRTFEELNGNHYQYSTLGRSRETLESMTCDCQYDHGLHLSFHLSNLPVVMSSLHRRRRSFNSMW